MFSLSVSDSKCSIVLICVIVGFVVVLCQVAAANPDSKVDIREMDERPKVNYQKRGRRIEGDKQKEVLELGMSMLDEAEKVGKAFGIDHTATNKFDGVNRVITPAYEVTFRDGQQDPHILVSHRNAFVAMGSSDGSDWAYLLVRGKQSWKVVEISLYTGGNELRICSGLKQGSPIFLVDSEDGLGKGRGCGVYRLQSDGTMQQVIDIAPHSKKAVLTEKGKLPRYIKHTKKIAKIQLFGWREGYGVVRRRMRYDKKKTNKIDVTTRWMKYDKEFKRQWVKDLADPPVYFRPTGSRRFPVVGVAWEEMLFPDNAGVTRLQYPDIVSARSYGMSTRPFIPDSDFVAVTTECGNRLPVIDLRGENPQIAFSIQVDPSPKMSFNLGFPEDAYNIAPVVVGDRLYVTEGNSNMVSCYALTRKATPSWPLSKSRFDGPDPEDNDPAPPNLLWRRYIIGINHPRIARLGYYQGNIIVPGWGNIFFLDEDSGKVNYRFSTMYDAGKKIVTGSEWRKKSAKLGMWNGIYRYTISGRYLVACTDNKREPTYIWRVPKIKRRTLQEQEK